MSILELDQDSTWRRTSSRLGLQSDAPMTGLAPPAAGVSRSNPKSGVQRIAVYGPVGIHRFLSHCFPTYSPQLLAAMPVDVFELAPRPARGSGGSGAERRRVADGIGTLNYIYPDESGAYSLISDEAHSVRAGPISHTVPCFGYAVTEHEKSHLDVDALVALGVPPGRLYGDLKAGRSIVGPSGKVITPEEVTIRGDAAQRVVILGDNCDAAGMLPLAAGADLVVHESTLQPGLERVARQRGHSTAAMAGAFARRCGARSLVLTHFGNGLCSTFEESTMNAFGRRDLEETIRAALAAGGRAAPGAGSAEPECAASPPAVGQLLGYWGGILETQRRPPGASLASAPPIGRDAGRPAAMAAVLENYDSWLRSSDLRIGELEQVDLFRHSFPECRSSTSIDSAAAEAAAAAAFGKPAVLLARDHMAVVLPRVAQAPLSSAQSGAAGSRPATCQ